MPRTEQETVRLARRIHQKLGSQIAAAVGGTLIPASFVGGLVSVENSALNPSSTRFETRVFNRLRQLRDKQIATYQNITYKQLEGTGDDALRNLATSFGYTQIMGWHTINNLNCTVADLRSPDKHLGYAVELLLLTAARYIREGAWEETLRIWNTGSPAGRTFSPAYVGNALAVMRALEEIQRSLPVDAPAIKAADKEGTAAAQDGRMGETDRSSAAPLPETLLAKLDETLSLQKQIQAQQTLLSETQRRLDSRLSIVEAKLGVR